MLVQDYLQAAAKKFPDKPAIITENASYSYREINDAADRLSTALCQKGVKYQDRVVIFLDNSVESIISMYGVLKIGAIFIMVYSGLKPPKLNYILKDSGASAIITHVNKKNVVQNAVQGADNLGFIVMCSDNKPIAEDLSKDITDKKEIIPWKILMECPYPKLPDCPAIDIDLATIVYTSGSTGEPKGVMSTHHNVISAATSITQYIRNTSEDIILNALPLSFDYGLYQIFMGFMFGCTIVIEKSFVYPYKVLERLVKEKVTGFPLVPTMLSLLFKMDDIGQFDFSNLRYISNTAAALPEAHIKRFSKLFPHVQIFSMYGLTECKRVSYLPPEDALKKPGSVGIPIPNEAVMILDENGREVPPGTVGELVIRGANVMQGYWNAPEETQKVFREGRYKGETLLYSGDYFKMDEEGYLYFISRKDDLIKTKGERVSPKEIENVLYRIDEVLGAAVVGIDDDIDGTVIVAFVQKDEKHELKETELKKFCKINLESYMVPKYFFIRDHLPKNNSGKIDKKMLLNEAVNFFGLDKPKN